MNHLSTQATALLIGGVILPLSSLSAQSADTFEFNVVPAAEPAEPAPASTAATEQTAATGVVTGRVVDKESGAPLRGVAVVVKGTETASVTGGDGGYRLTGVPEGVWDVGFVKSGYIEAAVTGLAVADGQTAKLDFVLAPRPAEMSDEVFELQDFTVSVEEANAMAANIELRMNSDKMLDLFSSEDFSKFAAGDVADALKRVSGVNIVEGQFAIIRGLEDRYSSTTYNGAPVPSPDPNSQSVQLDLFPSDIVSNLVVAKTFSGDLPSNSSGGSIDIVTHDYPEELEIKLSGGTGFNDAATDRFLQLQPGSATGVERSGFEPVAEHDIGLSIGGRASFKGREVRFKALASNEVDYETRTGVTESLEPRLAQIRNFPRPARVIRSGDLSLGQLSLSGGRFDLTQSDYTNQRTGYIGLGIDLDQAGKHKIDGSFFYTKKDEETVRLEENGFIPGLDYTTLSLTTFNPSLSSFNDFATRSAWILRGARETVVDDAPSRGHAWFAPTYESLSISQSRDLWVGQINGSHEFDLGGALTVGWSVNQAKTTQDEESFGARYFYEPDNDVLATAPDRPLTVEELGAGQFASTQDIFFSTNAIEEKQDFGRIDLGYEREVRSWLGLKIGAGVYHEKSDREVESRYLESPTVGGLGQFSVTADSQEELGSAIFDQLDRSGGEISGTRASDSTANRELNALSFTGKATFWEKVDLLGGVRLEDLLIESRNDPFFVQTDGRFNMFPNRFVLGNAIGLPQSAIGNPFTEGSPFDAADLPFLESLVNGRIDEHLALPSLGLTVRPFDGLSIRGAWSQTVARPSFREIGYYVSVDPGSSELVVGNPQLQLSDVESLDFRTEYTWGQGDLVAFSLFAKKVQKPIESLVIRDPTNAENSGGLFRTFINNPDTADIRGLEFEARKNLGFLGRGIGEYFSIGGNYTFIDAEVARTAAETANTAGFFGLASGDEAQFTAFSPTRRLFGQPEWIANADITFDQPEWGTRVTLAYFAISDVLDAAGSATVDSAGRVVAISLDRYIASYGQLDLVVSQKWGNWTFKASAKNLTNSIRKVVYDPSQTAREYSESSYKVGRDYSISASYSF